MSLKIKRIPFYPLTASVKDAVSLGDCCSENCAAECNCLTQVINLEHKTSQGSVSMHQIPNLEDHFFLTHDE